MVIQKGNNDFLIEFLKIERREKNGRERKIKNRCFSSGRSRKTGYSAAATAETRSTLS